MIFVELVMHVCGVSESLTFVKQVFTVVPFQLDHWSSLKTHLPPIKSSKDPPEEKCGLKAASKPSTNQQLAQKAKTGGECKFAPSQPPKLDLRKFCDDLKVVVKFKCCFTLES